MVDGRVCGDEFGAVVGELLVKFLVERFEFVGEGGFGGGGGEGGLSADCGDRLSDGVGDTVEDLGGLAGGVGWRGEGGGVRSW